MSQDKIAPHYHEFINLWQGMNWSAPPDALKTGELLDAKNFNIDQYGLTSRKGLSTDDETTLGAAIIGIAEMTTPSNSSVWGDRYIIYRVGTTIWQKTWDGASLGTATDIYVADYADATSNTRFTSGQMTYMTLFNNTLYCTDGVDENMRFNLNMTLTNGLRGQYVGIDAPLDTPTVAYQVDNYDGIYGTYRYKYVYLHDREAIKVYCDASDATKATMKKVGDVITIVITGGTSAATTTKDLSAAANDTIGELDTVLEAVSGIASGRFAGATCYSRYLYDFDEVNILGEDNEYAMEIKDVPLFRSNPSAKSDKYSAGRKYDGIAASSGDGSTTSFSDALTLDTSPDESVKAGSIRCRYVIGGQEYMAIDTDNEDGTGNFEGEYIESNPDGNTSIVTYDTGAIALYFLTAPDNNTDIYYDYLTAETVRVSVKPTTVDRYANKLEIYRTLNLLGEDADSTVYLKAGEVLNPGTGTVTFDDTVDDSDLTILMEENNTKPPKSYFNKKHKNRMMYMNSPDERDGDSLLMFSKPYNAECVPSSNYQYISKGDAYGITGGASFGDYFVVFKRDKFAVIEGDFEAMYYVSAGIGCIAPRSIVEFKDKVIFLSEYGWYSFDGVNLIPISEKINVGINHAGFFEGDKHLSEYSTSTLEHFAIFYPQNEQYLSFIGDTTKAYTFTACGHFIESLLAPEQLSELQKTNMMGWTYHQYDNHKASTNTDLRCIAPVQYSDGTIKLWVGGDDGYTYIYDDGTVDEVDSGSGETTYVIPLRMSTGWDALGTPPSVVKTARALNLSYTATASFSTTCTLKSYVDMIIASNLYTEADSITVEGGAAVLTTALYPGDMWSTARQLFSENYRTKGTGQTFMFVITNTTKSARMSIRSLGVWFRAEGVRFWTPTRT